MGNNDNDVNIYDDICDFDLGDEVDKLKTENELLREKICSLESDVEKLKCTIEEVKKSRDTLEKNISTLFLTAQGEIDRKNRMISELRTEFDNRCFRRSNQDIEIRRGRENNSTEVDSAKRFNHDKEIRKKPEVSEVNTTKRFNRDIEIKREREDKSSEMNTAKRFKSDSGRNDSHKHLDEINKNISKDNSKKSEHDINKSRRNEYEADKRSGYRSLSREENRGRSKSREESGTYKDDRGRRCDNKYRDECKSIVNRRSENSNFSSRNSRGECSKSYERARNISEAAPSYNEDLMKDGNYKKTKLDDKLMKVTPKIAAVKVSEDKILSDSHQRHSLDKTVPEKKVIGNVKPVKKRLKMLDEAEKKIKMLRSTPIKANISSSEQTPNLNSNSLKKASRNIAQEIDIEHRNNTKQFKAEAVGKEDSNKIKYSKKSSQHSVNDSPKKEDEKNTVCINISEDEKNSIQSEGQDVILTEGESLEHGSYQILNRKAREKAIKLSENLNDATIEDIKLTIKYHVTDEQRQDLNQTRRSSEVYLEAEYVGTKVNDLKENLTNTTIQNIEKPDMYAVITNLNVKSDVPKAAELKTKITKKRSRTGSSQDLLETSRHDGHQVMTVNTEDKKMKQSPTQKADAKSKISEVKEESRSFLRGCTPETTKEKVKLALENQIKEERKSDAHSKQQDDVNVVKDSLNTTLVPESTKILLAVPTNLSMEEEENDNQSEKQDVNMNLSVGNQDEKEVNKYDTDSLKTNLFDTADQEDIDNHVNEETTKSKENICDTGQSSNINVDCKITTQGTRKRRRRIKEKEDVNLGEELNLNMELVVDNSKNYEEREAKENSTRCGKSTLPHINIEHLQLENVSQVKEYANVILDEKDVIQEKKSDTKKKIKIHSNIELTPRTKQNVNSVIQDSTKEEIKDFRQSKLRNVNLNEKNLKDADYEGMEGKKCSSYEHLHLQDSIKEDDNGNSLKKQDLNVIEKCLNTNIENEGLIIKETANTVKQVENLSVKDQVGDETETVNISKGVLSNVAVYDTNKNSNLVDNEKEIKEKINNAAKDLTDITKPSDITLTKEEITISLKKDVSSITSQDSTLNMNSYFSSVTKGNRKETNTNFSKEDLIHTQQNLSLDNKEVKNIKHSELDINGTEESSNVNLDTRNIIKDDKKAINEKIKSLFGEDSTDTAKYNMILDKKINTVKQSKKLDTSEKTKCLVKNLPSTTKVKKPPPDKKITSKEAKGVEHSKKQNICMTDNSANLDEKGTAKNRKKEMKNIKSTTTEDLSDSTKQSNNLVTEETIKDVSQFKAHALEISKMKSSSKEDLTNDTKQDKRNVLSENQDKTLNKKPLIDDISSEKSKEKKINPRKKFLPNIAKAVENNIKKGRTNEKHGVNRINEDTNNSLIPENKEVSKEMKKLPKKIYSATDQAVNLTTDHRTFKENEIGGFKPEKDNFRGTKRPSKDLTGTSHGDSGEKKDTKHSEILEKSRQFPIENRDTRTTSKDKKKDKKNKRSISKDKSIDTAEPEIDDSGKRVCGFTEVDDKAINKHSKEVVESKNITIEEVTEKLVKNAGHKSKRDKKIDANKTCSEKIYPEFSSCEVKKKESQSRDKAVATKETEQTLTTTSGDLKKSKEEDSKESTGTTSSEEVVNLKIMKFSDMQDILRRSFEEPATTKNTPEIKQESDNHAHDTCSTGELKKHCKINDDKDSKIRKSRRASESNQIGKSKEYISDSSASENTKESCPISSTNLLDEKLNTYIQYYIDKPIIDDPKHSVPNKSNKRRGLKKEIINVGENVNITNDCEISNVTQEQQTVADNYDRVINKDLINLCDSPKTNDQCISSGISRNTNLPSKDIVQMTVENATSEKPQTRRRITPTPVKSNIPICSFKNILGKTHESPFPQVSPLHLTHEGEIPVLHLEDNHINNLPTETHINDKNIINLLDTMNISNMECDIPKISCDTVGNSGDSNVNVSPIKGNNSLTFKNIITKVTSTPVPKTECQIASSDATAGVRNVSSNVSNGIILNKTSNTGVQGSTTSTFRRRRRCRLVMID